MTSIWWTIECFDHSIYDAKVECEFRPGAWIFVWPLQECGEPSTLSARIHVKLLVAKNTNAEIEMEFRAERGTVALYTALAEEKH